MNDGWTIEGRSAGASPRESSPGRGRRVTATPGSDTAKRVGRALRVAAGAAGGAAWSAYGGRLLLRSLHMLQLEGYQTVRFLEWSTRRPDRWAPPDRLLTGLDVVLVGAAGLTTAGRPVVT